MRSANDNVSGLHKLYRGNVETPTRVVDKSISPWQGQSGIGTTPEVTITTRTKPAPGVNQVFRYSVIVIEADGKRYVTQDWFEVPNNHHGKAQALQAFERRRRQFGY